MGMKKLLYFHGFGSSGQTETAKILRELLPEFLVLSLDIPVDPKEALPYLKSMCEQGRPDVIVGTSMGALYAHQMHGFKRICINPAWNLSEQRKVIYPGTFKFFNPRKDGQQFFTITDDIIRRFADMEKHQFDGITDFDRDNVYGLFADNDNVVNCLDLFLQHYHHYSHFHGEHHLTREAIQEVVVPQVRQLVP